MIYLKLNFQRKQDALNFIKCNLMLSSDGTKCEERMRPMLPVHDMLH